MMKKKNEVFEPKIIAFACRWCGVGKNEINAIEDFPNFKLIKLMCSGRINTSLILKTFEKGADGVMAFGCPEGKCHYNFGNRNAIEEYKIIKEMMDLLGIESKRFILELDFFSEDGKLDSVVNEFVKGVKKLGPSPICTSKEKVKTQEMKVRN
jgi:F420-non-reducing hydrogenase iron-sulfur subunit